jgi:VWFA-related protein
VRLSCLLASMIAVLVLGSATAAARKEPVFRSDIALVRVDTQVTDGQNRNVAKLKVEDFVLAENGALQPIRHFGNEDMPLDVVLLFDVSRSMRPHLERLAGAAHEALGVLGEQDRVAMIVFENSSRLRLPFRTNRADIVSEFERLLRDEKFERGTEIPRAIIEAAKYMGSEARPEARRAIVIVTDDRTNTRSDDKGVSRALAKADAVLSALIVPDAMRGGPGQGQPGDQGPPQRRRSSWPGLAGIGPGGGTWGGGGGGGGGMGGPTSDSRGGMGGSRGGGMGGPRVGGPGGPPGGSMMKTANTAEIALHSGGDSMSIDDNEPLKTTLTRIRERYTLHFYLPSEVKPGEERTIDVLLSAEARRRYPEAKLRFRDVYIAPKQD